MVPQPRILYLHGFASSPSSRKATFLASRLRELGYRVEIPALDEDDFQGLTISRQIEFVRPYIEAGPLSLIGSSLGGYLAALLGARYANVQRLVLLAPAFGFHRLWTAELGPERLSAWRETGTLEVYHYGAGCALPLRYDLMQDAEKYEPCPEFGQPSLIFHGENDPVVPIAQSERFASAHPNARLIRLPSGHELTDVLDRIWAETRAFFETSNCSFRC